MTTILLQIADESLQQRLADSLREEKFNVISQAIHSILEPDVDAVLSDRSTELKFANNSASTPAASVAIGAIGWEGPADVVLPKDITHRELTLVSSLLAEITRLRRESSHRHLERSEMRQLAFSDALTSVANRRAWDQEAEQQFQIATASGRTLGLAIIDLDHFKQVNDHYGHATGDETLKAAARAIAAGVRASDFLARLGGDEFGLLLPDVAPSAIGSVMERIRRAIATHCSRPVGPKVSASIGYAVRRDETKFSQFFEHCDEALFRAKSAGRDRAVAG